MRHSMACLWLFSLARFIGAASGPLESKVTHITAREHAPPDGFPHAAQARDKVVPRYGGNGPDKRKGPDGKELKSLLNVGVDPNDPHGKGFEPRPGTEESGDIWSFGRAHAAVHHVLEKATKGNASSVATALEAFSAEHSLSFGLGALPGRLIEETVRRRAEAAAAAAVAAGRGQDGLNILVLRAGLGARTLRCLPPLLEIGRPGSVYEVVSIEEDHHLQDYLGRLVDHALDSGVSPDSGTELPASVVDVRHTPLMPGEGTPLEEVLESLGEDSELTGYDAVVLGGSRAEHQQDLEILIEHGRLRPRAVVYSDGLARGDAGTEQYIHFLQRSGGRLDYEVHDIPGPSATGEDAAVGAVVVATLQDSQRGSEL